MSSSGQIKARIGALNGRTLFHLPPSMPGEPPIRDMFVSEEVFEAVNEPWPANWMGQRQMMFRAVLDSFSRGDWLTVSETPGQAGEAVIARVDPITDEIWDIRCLSPETRIRCFGAFGGKDLFVGLTWQYREDLDTPSEWSTEINRCKNQWHHLFGSIPRFKGRTLDDYLSNFYPV